MNVSRIFRGIQYVIVALIVALGVLLGASAVPLFGKYGVYTVLSGSMAPTISTGSIVVVRPQETYTRGDVITAKSGDPHRPVTHRIVDVTPEGFVTQGDANAAPDSIVRAPKDVLGRVVFHVPLVGYPIAWVQTPQGFIFLLVIPSVLIVYHEILSMATTLEKTLRQRTRRTHAQRE